MLTWLTSSIGGRALVADGWSFSRAQFYLGLAICGLVAVLVAGVFAVLYLRFNSRAVKGPEYLHEPPADLPPAIVDTLFTTAPSPAKMVATLLDLVRREVITMTKVHSPETGDPAWATHDDHALHLHRDKLASLSASERDFVYELRPHRPRGRRRPALHAA